MGKFDDFLQDSIDGCIEEKYSIPRNDPTVKSGKLYKGNIPEIDENEIQNKYKRKEIVVVSSLPKKGKREFIKANGTKYSIKIVGKEVYVLGMGDMEWERQKFSKMSNNDKLEREIEDLLSDLPGDSWSYVNKIMNLITRYKGK